MPSRRLFGEEQHLGLVVGGWVADEATGRGRDDDTVEGIPIAGSNTGWARLGYGQDGRSAVPGTGYVLAMTPDKNKPMPGFVAQTDETRLYEDHLSYTVGPQAADEAARTIVYRADDLHGLDFTAVEQTLASAATVDLGGVPSLKVAISGTTPIGSFGTRPNAVRMLRFLAATTLTASASLALPGGVDLPVAADDVLIATSSATGVWRVRHVQAADGSVRASVVTPMTATSTLGTAAAPWQGLFATTVTAGAGGSFASLLINGNADSDAGATLAGRKSRGTLAAPAVVQANDRILQLTGQAYQGTAYVTAAQVIGRVIAPTPSATNLQSRLEVLLAPANSIAQNSALTLDFTAGLGLLGSTVVDGARHLRTRPYTRATLPTPSSASLGVAHASNPEGGKGELVINTAGTAWRYMDGTAVTIA